MTTKTRKFGNAIKQVGKLEITDEVFISDPCYSVDTWCTATVNLPAGIYNCYAVKVKGIVESIFILKESFDEKGELYLVDFDHEIPECGVDSGQLGIFNKSKFNKGVSKGVFEKVLEKEFPYEDWKRLWEEGMSDKDSFYKCCCNHTLTNDKCGVIEGVGFVSSSGYGDGAYVPMYLTDFNENRIGLQINFVEFE